MWTWFDDGQEATLEAQGESDENGNKEATIGNVASNAKAIEISEEQRARMEASKLKALQKAAAARAARSAPPSAL